MPASPWRGSCCWSQRPGPRCRAKRADVHTPRRFQLTRRSETKQKSLEIVMIKKLLVAATLAASIGSLATPASAVVYVRVAPPEPRAEIAPEPRRGRTWVAGHW